MRLALDPPLINASGILSYPDVFELLERRGAVFGAYVTKSIGLETREGNKNPIIYEDENGILYNSVALPNSLEGWLEELKDKGLRSPLIGSVFGYRPEHYPPVVEAIDPFVDAHELNLSSPNRTPDGKSVMGSVGDKPQSVAEIVSSVRKITVKPLIAKISPNVDYKRIAKVAEENGADYIGCANTVGPGMPLDARTGKPFLAGRTGGMSGPAIKAINMKVTYEVYEIIDPATTGIVAYGGIGAVQDIIDYCRAGAEIFGLGTALAHKSTAEMVSYTNRLWGGLQAYLKGKNTTLEKLRGTAHV